MTDPIQHHAEAILRAAGSSLRHYTMPGTRAAILTACQALADGARDEGFDAGAEAMREAASKVCDEWYFGEDAQDVIRTIQPAGLRGTSHE